MNVREEEVLQVIIRILAEQLNPRRMILFGSRAEGRARIGSDFDVAVEAPRPEFRKRWQIEEMVDEAIGLYEADIVYLSAVEEPFRRLIEKTGKVIYEREETRGVA